jgi:malonyl-ACP decarboxylase
MKQPVAITGLGVVSSIGNNVEMFTNALREGNSGIDSLPTNGGPAISPAVGAMINGFSIDSALERHEGFAEDFLKNFRIATMRAPQGIQYSTVSALEAWCRAGLDRRSPDPEKIGIVVGGSNLTQDYSYGLMEKFNGNPLYLNPRYPLHYMDTDHVGTVSHVLGIRGEGYTVGGASASGSLALIKGMHMIWLGDIDVCLVIGAMANLSPMEMQGFHNIGAMGGRRFKDQPQKACRPFDSSHEGFIYGQGCGCMVLESLQSVESRGGEILALLCGGAQCLDGNCLSNPDEEGEVRAMTMALRQAGVDRSEVDYVNAHGTSSPLGDKTEVRALKKVLGDRLDKVWINSTKSLTGHCLSSAGMIESIATVLQMVDGFIHPNLNLEQPIDDCCRFAGDTSAPAVIGVALKNSFGFGGINTSLVFRRD